MRMIIMSVGEFGAFYKNLNDCKSRVALQGKVGAMFMVLFLPHSHIQIFFSIYELLVTLMLLNLLIAMMTRTYEKIAETEKEWKRQVEAFGNTALSLSIIFPNCCSAEILPCFQWAQVILMLEQSLTNAERSMAIYSYSRPLRSDKARRAFVVRLKSDVSLFPSISFDPFDCLCFLQTQRTFQKRTESPQKVEFIRKKHSARLSQSSHLHVSPLR